MSEESFQEKVLSELSSIKSDVATLKSDVVALKSDVVALKSDFALLKLDVRDLRKDRNWIMAIGVGMILSVFAPITVAAILGILKIIGVV